MFRVLFLVGLFSLAGPGLASAQSISYQRLPIGDRAVGMGGAYTGVAEDLSAAWYNPGGLALQNNAAVSGALFLRLYDRFRIADGYGYEGQTTDLVAEGTLATPFFVGGMTKVGDEEDPADRRHAVAGSGIGPSVPTRRFDASVTPEAGVGAALSIVSQESQEYYGPSYAYRLSDDLGIGISAYVSVQNSKYDESEFIGLYGPENPDGTYADTNLGARVSGGRAEVISFLFRLGALWQVREDLRLGLTLQLPNIPFVRSSEVFEYKAAVTQDGVGRFEGSSVNTQAGLPQPLELRLGASYRPRDNWRIAFDFSFYGPIGSEDNPVPIYGEPEGGGGTAPDPGRFLADGLYARPWFNMALGMETVVADIFPVSFGVYSDLAPTLPIDGPSDVFTPAHINSVGLTGVVGIRKGGLNVAVGVAVVLGWGKTLGSNPTAVAPAYTPRDVDQQAIYMFFTGYMSAAEQLAGTLDKVRLGEEEVRAREAERQRLEDAQQACEERLAEELRSPEDAARETGPGREPNSSQEPQGPPEPEDASSVAPPEETPDPGQ